MDNFKLENLMPMMPNEGPPLPKFFDIYWPWYKKEVPGVYTCPYCGATFSTEDELNAHIVAAHPEVPPVAEFRVSNLVISPAEVNPGKPVTISCTVANRGSQAGTYTVKIGGDFMAEQSVTLQPGESKGVSFEVTPDVAKTYQVLVNGLSGSFRVTTVPVADIRLSNLVITPVEVNVGQKVTISVNATNQGAAAGSKTITCNVS